MFDAIQFVTSPFAMIAFLSAAGVAAYWVKHNSEVQKINSLPEAKRFEMIEQMARDFHIIPTANLTKAQRVALIQQAMENRFRTHIVVSVVACVLLIAAAILFGRTLKNETKPPKPTVDVILSPDQ